MFCINKIFSDTHHATSQNGLSDQSMNLDAEAKKSVIRWVDRALIVDVYFNGLIFRGFCELSIA
jgi:hypothetical protein